MRYIADTDGYVKQVSFGADIVCNGANCTEYTGDVPSGYTSLEAWYLEEVEKLYRWKIVGGNLTLDSTAVAPSSSIALTVLKERVRGMTYACRREHGRAWLRFYAATNTTLSPGYWYDLVQVNSSWPEYMHALSLACAKMASVRINTNVIQIRPYEEIVAGYDLYITGSWQPRSVNTDPSGPSDPSDPSETIMTATHDGAGNVTVHGATATHDGAGNVTII